MVGNGHILNEIASYIGLFGLGLFLLCFVVGMFTEEEVSTSSSGNSFDLDDDDLFAIATGNEEYLAAHCVTDPKVEIENEKLEIQRLKNQLARLQVEQKLAQIKSPKQATAQPSQSNQLISECVNALVSLGEKRSTARATTNRYFAANPNTKTVNQFIAGVFKK